ncbi:dihydrofolate reductase family protein [Streptomyces alkaliphilus]|uniref:dihydrofolate reductase family protein n=1 Tax=Streptomyces alkaliphilus TaxID=1472722 RepID=UPI001E5C9338|nr:dihydrofolate reductase family protein [Streptomyces alkaliphilus]
MSATGTGNGKVVVNRSMSLDGFIAGPDHAMDWIFDFVAPDEFPELAAATGAMLIGRRTHEVGNRMRADNPDGTDYPFSGPVFVLTHRPPEPPDPAVTFLTGDIGEAVATARRAAGGKNLEILGADVAGQCLRRGLVDEILVYVLPVLLGDGIRFSPPASPGRTWNRSTARGRAPSPSSGSASPGSPGLTRPGGTHSGGCDADRGAIG